MSRIRIKVLEPEYKKCEELEQEAIKALLGFPIVAEMERVHDLDKIKKYNLPETPGLIINDKLKVFGRIPQKEEIREWIREEYKAAN